MVLNEQTKKVRTGQGLQLSPAHLRSVDDVERYLDYLEDEQHPNHAQHRIAPLKFYNCSGNDRAGFMKCNEHVVRCRASACRSKGGRPPKWLSRVFVVSTEHQSVVLKNTDGETPAMLTQEEMDYYGRRFVDESGYGACGISWHVDVATGRVDGHIVVLNCDPGDPSKALKPWQSSIIQRRILSDRIENEINQERRFRSEVLLRSMQEVRRAKKAEAGVQELYVQIGERARAPVSDKNVEELIAEAGHEVTRHSSETISVRHQGKKKAFRYKLKELLESAEVWRLRSIATELHR